jgi:hypothetical protein
MMDKTIRSSKTPKIVLLPGKQNKIKEKKKEKGVFNPDGGSEAQPVQIQS